MLLDFTTADPGAITHLNRHSWKSYGVAAVNAELSKNQHYADNFDVSKFVFQACAVEVPGRWSRGMYRVFKLIKDYAFRNRTQNDIRHSLFVCRWRKILCTVIRVAQAISCDSLSRSLAAGHSLAIAID